MTLGNKIQKLRKQNGLSQEALAEKVTVTRQTISKWELDQSTPDLEFIVQLCEIFGVSADYLIKEDMTEPDEIPSRKKGFHISDKVKRIILIAVSVMSLIAACTCLICDYFTAESLSWSLISIVSILSGWLILLPCLTAGKKIVAKTLLIISIIPFPLLALIAFIYKKPIILSLGVSISFIGIISVWMIYMILYKCRKRLWLGCAYSLLLIIPISASINHTVATFLKPDIYDRKSDIFNSIITFMLSLICFGVNYLSTHKKGTEIK